MPPLALHTATALCVGLVLVLLFGDPRQFQIGTLTLEYGSVTLPVLGVPVDAGPLRGEDALLSTVMMPPGIPVGTLGIGKSGARNAALFAARILALRDKELATRLDELRERERTKTLEKDSSVRKRFDC